MDIAIILVLVLLALLVLLFGPLLIIKAMGYLVQKYKFGVPFKEVYAYHKEQDELERLHKAKNKK